MNVEKYQPPQTGPCKQWKMPPPRPLPPKRKRRRGIWMALLLMMLLSLIVWRACGCAKTPRSLLLEDQQRDPVAEGCICGATPMNQYDMIGKHLFSRLDAELKYCGGAWTPLESSACHCRTVDSEKFVFVDQASHMTANADMNRCLGRRKVREIQE